MILLGAPPLDACSECVKQMEEDNEEFECKHETPRAKRIAVIPYCCKANRDAVFPRVQVHVDWDHPKDVSKWQVSWYIPSHGVGLGEVTHCPFCGIKLPKIVKNPKPPSPVYSPDADGLCACGWPKAFGDCACWPIESLFSLEEKEKSSKSKVHPVPTKTEGDQT